MNFFDKIYAQTKKIVADANFCLRNDVVNLLRSAYKSEKNKKAKQALFWIIKNASIAKKKKIAICQDTGLPVIFIESGTDLSINYKLVDTIKKGVFDGYLAHSLRQSIIDPLTRKQPSIQELIYHIDFSSKKKGISVTIFPKGFGSENKSRLRMFNPTASVDKIEEFIVNSVKKAGPEGCPPFIVGVGIGGTCDQSLLLAKKALLNDLTRKNPEKQIRNLEKRLLIRINNLNIGPMGLGGKHTCLAVKIKKAPTHIAGLPVGVNISCHALRSSRFKINKK